MIVKTDGSFAALIIRPALPADERRAVLEVVLQQAHGDVLVQGVLVLSPRAARLETRVSNNFGGHIFLYVSI